MLYSLRRGSLVPGLVLSLCLGATSASAQYFGSNKVQYKTFDFEVLKTEHFDVYFYPEERDAAARAARMAERWNTRLMQTLQHKLSSTQPLVLYASHPEFEQTNIVDGTIGEGTGGVTESFKRRIVLPLAGTMAATDHVIGHELVHAFQYDLADRASRGQSGEARGLERLPLWFIEGMAEYLSIGPIDPHTAMWIRDAAREERLPTIRQLNDPRYFPYRWGQAFWAYVAGRFGDQVVGQILNAALRSGSVEDALRRVLEVAPDDLSRDWHLAIRTAYDPLVEQTRATIGRRLSPERGPGAELSVSPSLSPDGTQVVYFSQRSLYSIDMVLADVATGRVIRTVAETAVDPHFSSLQFINSTGSWRADGQQFLFAAISGGSPVLAVYDIARGRVEREISFPTLGEILTPSWSPDGRFVAFSAITGGSSDLFVYDLQEGALRRATDDPFADLQPAWSPDGRLVAFVTDRFGTDLASLTPANYGLALFDPTSGAISRLSTFEGAKSINPAWAPDSDWVYFLSDRNGVTNLYAVRPAGGSVQAFSNLYGGLSGITALSPALTAARTTRRVVVSSYEQGQYHLYAIDEPEALAGEPVSPPAIRVSPAVLPPQDRSPGDVSRLLADSTTGLPEPGGEVEPYRTRLSLDYVGQPYVTAGLDPFGTFVGGGLALFFSDMLGDHNLTTAVQTDTSFGDLSDIPKNTAGVVSYQNRKRRWNWGASVQQVPYLSGGFSSGIAVADGGGLVAVERSTIVRQTSRGVSGLTAYPFSRARRFEIGGGYQSLSFARQDRTVVASLTTGQILLDERTTTSLGESLNLGTASAAMVFDTSVFGATSPVAGGRSRFEVTPTVGTLNFTGALADYRRYLVPAPFYTIAGRVLHYGRYGSGSEDSRLIPLFIGYPQLVRGYSIGSFGASECRPDATSPCPAFDRLLGTRMLVGNLELRFPLLRPFGLSERMYGPLPVEVALFADGGVAWTSDVKPTFAGGSREPVASAGVSFRVNLFGFAVGQIDIARPFQRTTKSWMFEFSLTPGF